MTFPRRGLGLRDRKVHHRRDVSQIRAPRREAERRPLHVGSRKDLAGDAPLIEELRHGIQLPSMSRNPAELYLRRSREDSADEQKNCDQRIT